MNAQRPLDAAEEQSASMSGERATSDLRRREQRIRGVGSPVAHHAGDTQRAPDALGVGLRRCWCEQTSQTWVSPRSTKGAEAARGPNDRLMGETTPDMRRTANRLRPTAYISGLSVASVGKESGDAQASFRG